MFTIYAHVLPEHRAYCQYMHMYYQNTRPISYTTKHQTQVMVNLRGLLISFHHINNPTSPHAC